MWRWLALFTLVTTLPAVARATPAPDSVAVVANADAPGSVAIAMRYAEERSIPAGQVCLLSLPTGAEMTFDELRTRLVAPLDTCLGAARDRIEAIVLVRGVPIRAATPSGAPVSVAAALGLWDSTLPDGMPMLGSPPGVAADCGGTPCTRARVRNPYAAEPFYAGWEFTTVEGTIRPALVTMLHGRSDADAESLIDVALMAEAAGGARATFTLMRGADAARGALDPTYPSVASALMTRGMTVEVVDFAPDLTGRTFAGFMTGTAGLGMTIEGNTYAPGALVDNLTSFGAVPENFEPTGESQVSIARWVTAGASGVHGTVAEPLNNCFPGRELLVDYVDGATLAEAYLGRMPYVYWLNLVLGDPMLAPYAERPMVQITGLTGGATFDARTITVTATPPSGRAIASLILYVDGAQVARSDGTPIEHCLAPRAAGDVELLAVARTALDMAATHPYPGAGWASLAASASGSMGTCSAPDAGLDAGAADASVARDVGGDASMAAGSGCACSTPSLRSRRRHALLMIAIALALLTRRRAR